MNYCRALEQLSVAFATVKRASKQARDVAYIHTLAAAAGLSVKEYQRLLEMFNRIDQDKVGYGLTTNSIFMGYTFTI